MNLARIFLDWGDALVADRHYELAQIQLNLFDGTRRCYGRSWITVTGRSSATSRAGR